MTPFFVEIGVYLFWLLCYAVFFLFRDTSEEEEQIRSLLSGRVQVAADFVFRHAEAFEGAILAALIVASSLLRSPWVLVGGSVYYVLGLFYVVSKRFLFREEGE